MAYGFVTLFEEFKNYHNIEVSHLKDTWNGKFPFHFPCKVKLKLNLWIGWAAERLETLQGAWHNTDTSLLELGENIFSHKSSNIIPTLIKIRVQLFHVCTISSSKYFNIVSLLGNIHRNIILPDFREPQLLYANLTLPFVGENQSLARLLNSWMHQLPVDNDVYL